MQLEVSQNTTVYKASDSFSLNTRESISDHVLGDNEHSMLNVSNSHYHKHHLDLTVRERATVRRLHQCSHLSARD